MYPVIVIILCVSFKGCTLLLMGSADKLPEKPKEQVKFVEDLPEDEAAAVSFCFI